jgi:hypothetical protein
MGCCARVRLPRGLRLSAFRVLSSFVFVRRATRAPLLCVKSELTRFEADALLAPDFPGYHKSSEDFHILRSESDHLKPPPDLCAPPASHDDLLCQRIDLDILFFLAFPI